MKKRSLAEIQSLLGLVNGLQILRQEIEKTNPRKMSHALYLTHDLEAAVRAMIRRSETGPANEREEDQGLPKPLAAAMVTPVVLKAATTYGVKYVDWRGIYGTATKK